MRPQVFHVYGGSGARVVVGEHAFIVHSPLCVRVHVCECMYASAGQFGVLPTTENT